MKKILIIGIIAFLGTISMSNAQEEAAFTNVQEVVEQTTYSGTPAKIRIVPGSSVTISDAGVYTGDVQALDSGNNLILFQLNNKTVDSRTITLTKSQFNTAHGATSAANPTAHNQKAFLKAASVLLKAEYDAQ